MTTYKGVTHCKAHCKVCFKIVDAEILTTNQVLSNIKINCKDCYAQRNNMTFGIVVER